MHQDDASPILNGKHNMNPSISIRPKKYLQFN
jgi:hypothetical protein